MRSASRCRPSEQNPVLRWYAARYRRRQLLLNFRQQQAPDARRSVVIYFCTTAVTACARTVSLRNSSTSTGWRADYRQSSSSSHIFLNFMKCQNNLFELRRPRRRVLLGEFFRKHAGRLTSCFRLYAQLQFLTKAAIVGHHRAFIATDGGLSAKAVRRVQVFNVHQRPG